MTEQLTADFVFISEAIFTGETDRPFAGAIAIKDNTILTVDTKEAIARYIGSTTKTIEYGSKLIMPGFNDFHIHLFLGSLYQNSVSLAGAASEAEAAYMVKRFADEHPDEEWIFGFNWYHVYWTSQELPHKKTLDELLPDRPVFLINDECHGAWVNSKALELMGIDAATPDPAFGEIVRDEDGEPTGFLYETAMTFAQQVFEQIPIQKQTELLSNFQQYAASYGVTSVSDMLPLPGLELGNLALYQQFEADDQLTTRIHFLAALNGDLAHAKQLRDQYQSAKVRFSGLKQFLDGVPTAYTALLVDPYSDEPNTSGDTLIPVDYIRSWIMEADEAGFRIRLHACGDGAVRLGLDCLEEAERQNGKRDSRHTIEHIEVIHPDDMNRFAQLDVIASMQPEHMAPSEAFAENVYPLRLGADRDPYTFPIKTLQDSGATVAFGTDFPVVDLNPMLEIYRAVTRQHNDGAPGAGWNGKEKISLADALRHYTVDAAYGVFREDELGTLTAGKLADITVLDCNPFQTDPDVWKQARAVLTMMDGKIVYESTDSKEGANLVNEPSKTGTTNTGAGK